MFAWTNETVNVWTHLLGFILFLYLCLWDNLVWIPSVDGSFTDRLILTLGLMCYQVFVTFWSVTQYNATVFQFCMLASTGYHLFRCHSETACNKWLALDLTGISVGLLGCYLPGIHLGFYCLSVSTPISVLFSILLSDCTGLERHLLAGHRRPLCGCLHFPNSAQVLL